MAQTRHSTRFTKENHKLLFLHGYRADSNSFYYQYPFFERDFEIFHPDFKGFGTNADMQYAYSLDDYVFELCEYMYKHSLENAHVIAHSFGARVVVKGVALNRLQFDKIVITGGAGLKPRQTVKKRLNKFFFNVLKTFVDKEKLQGFYSSDYLALSPIMRESFKKIISEHVDHLLENVHNRTLLIFGALDKETPLYMAKRFNRGIKNSTLSIYDGAGHFAFIDKPIKFNTEVKEFLLS